jgi:hypothetical protein
MNPLSGLRVDQPSVLVVGLVGQRVTDLLQIQAAQLRHGTRIDPCLNHEHRTGGDTHDRRPAVAAREQIRR